jgi:hypothetical protein
MSRPHSSGGSSTLRWAAQVVVGRSEVVALVREVVRITAVHLASCDEGYGHFGRFSAGVRRPAQQWVQPTPPLRHFGPEKTLVVHPVLPRELAVLRWRG